jgi:hypothetical protein
MITGTWTESDGSRVSLLKEASRAQRVLNCVVGRPKPPSPLGLEFANEHCHRPVEREKQRTPVPTDVLLLTPGGDVLEAAVHARDQILIERGASESRYEVTCPD